MKLFPLLIAFLVFLIAENASAQTCLNGECYQCKDGFCTPEGGLFPLGLLEGRPAFSPPKLASVLERPSPTPATVKPLPTPAQAKPAPLNPVPDKPAPQNPKELPPSINRPPRVIYVDRPVYVYGTPPMAPPIAPGRSLFTPHYPPVSR